MLAVKNYKFWFCTGSQDLYAAHDIYPGERQNDEHDQLENGIIDQKRQVRAKGGTNQCNDHANGTELPGNIALARIAVCGKARAHKAAELVGGNGIMYGQAADHIGGQADQPAAARNGIHKTCQKYQRANDQKMHGGECDHKNYLPFRQAAKN